MLTASTAMNKSAAGGSQAGGSLSFTKDNEIEYLKYEVNKLKKQVNCTTCQLNPKQMVLPCGHLFCNDCI